MSTTTQRCAYEDTIDMRALCHCLPPSLTATTLRQCSRIAWAMLVMMGRVTRPGISRWVGTGGRYRTVQCFVAQALPQTELVPAHQVQTHRFDRHDRERSQRLMAALDAINTQWGRGTIRYAAVGVQPRWRMRCARRSPRYTTRWQELVVVRCAG